MRVLKLLTCVLVLFAATNSVRAEIVLTGGRVEAGNESQFYAGIPSSDGASEVFFGGSTSIDYVLSQGGGQTGFDLTYVHDVDAGAELAFIVDFASLNFKALSSGNYQLSGIFSADPAAAQVNLMATLTNQTLGTTLFSSDLYSFSSADPLVLELDSGKTGSATGVIVGGHDYRLTLFAISVSFGPAVPIHLDGDFHFQINDTVSAVPEPSSVGLLAIGGCGALFMMAIRRRWQGYVVPAVTP